VDVLPTMLQAVGISVPQECKGIVAEHDEVCLG